MIINKTKLKWLKIKIKKGNYYNVSVSKPHFILEMAIVAMYVNEIKHRIEKNGAKFGWKIDWNTGRKWRRISSNHEPVIMLTSII
jgi:hypothetical protein